MKLEIPYFKQEKSTTCGPACVRMVATYYGTELLETKIEEACETSWLGNTCEELASGAQKLGFEVEVVENLDREGLKDSLRSGIPIIALLDSAILYGGVQGFGHFVVIIGLKKGIVYYHDPDLDKDLVKDAKVFFDAWSKYSFKGVKIWKSMRK
ncbi:MAG: cysteine peptidase family C39 domain-containing protein [Nitrospirota bacterium]